MFVRALRLCSGLTLGLFLLTHFINIATGLKSAGTMDAARPFLTGLWSNPVGNVVLYGALLAHVGLTLRALYDRRTLAMSTREAVQLACGLLFPFLLVAHVVGTEIVPVLSGRPMRFVDEVYLLQVKTPPMGGRQAAALIVGWLHGCLGLRFWLRSKSWFRRAAPLALALALIIPLVAILGFVEAGKEVERVPPTSYDVEPWVPARAETFGFVVYAALAASIGGVLIARGLRPWMFRRPQVRIAYPDGRTITVPAGFSILEASRSGGIPHLSVCGGRGRCSTCRVRVLGNLTAQPPADAAERATLDRIKAEPNVRLACQLRPTHDLAIFPVFAAVSSRAIASGITAAAPASGVERNLAVLFCDLRSFTRHAERLLPYDTVFILNRYFHVVGEAIETSGGHLDKFIGDGALALFGLDGDAPNACRQALKAAALIARGLDELNVHLGAELGESLRIAMGLHFGPAVIGEMGYGRATSLTAIGDGINVASRLEAVAKEHGVEAVISTALTEAAAVSLLSERQVITIVGRAAPVEAVLIRDARALERLAS